MKNAHLIMLALLLTILSPKTYAISEINYKETYHYLVAPLLNEFEYGSFEGINQIKINYAQYSTNQEIRSCVVIFPGKSEPLEKYAEVIHSLNDGITFGKYKYFMMDHRGQGSSGRMLKDNRYKGHIDEFENYILDAKKFMDEVVLPSGCETNYLLAHSMGAGIGIALDMEYPGYFKKMGLISPMLKIITAPYPYTVAKAMVKANILRGKRNDFAPGQSTWSGKRNFPNNKFTTSEVRYEMTMDIYDLYPETKLGGVTNNWLNQVMKKTDKLRKNYDQSLTPSRVYIAGNELYSEPKEMKRFCKLALSCQTRSFLASKHEILMDQDMSRSLAIADLLLFFN